MCLRDIIRTVGGLFRDRSPKGNLFSCDLLALRKKGMLNAPRDFRKIYLYYTRKKPSSFSLAKKPVISSSIDRVVLIRFRTLTVRLTKHTHSFEQQITKRKKKVDWTINSIDTFACLGRSIGRWAKRQKKEKGGQRVREKRIWMRKGRKRGKSDVLNRWLRGSDFLDFVLCCFCVSIPVVQRR